MPAERAGRHTDFLNTAEALLQIIRRAYLFGSITGKYAIELMLSAWKEDHFGKG
jgi:hypothetical protein